MEPIGSLEQEQTLKQKKGSVFDDSTFTVSETKEDRISESHRDMERMGEELSGLSEKSHSEALSSGRTLEKKKSLNETVAESVPAFDKLLKREFNESGFEHEIDNYTIKELIDEMEKDTHKKHTEFKQMESALKMLYTLKDDIHTAGNSNSSNPILDYRHVIRLVKSTAKLYQTTHNRSHITPWGRSRLKISGRIIDIITRFERYANDLEMGRIVDLTEKVDCAGIEEIIKTASLSDGEKGKNISFWLDNGGKYREVLRKIIKDEGLDELDRDSFARVMEDKNRRLIANKVTLNMIADEVPGITLRLSGLEEELKKHVKADLEKNDSTRKNLFAEMDNFRGFVSDSITSYYEKNKDRIKKAKDRKEKFIEVLGLDKDESSYFKRADVNDLILNKGDQEYEFSLSSLKAQSEDNDSLIYTVLKDLDFSTLTIDRVKNRIKRELKALAIFGGEMDIAGAVRERVQKLRYILPYEAEAESRIKHLMESYHIPPMDRDAFAKFLAKNTGKPKEVAETRYIVLISRARTYVSNLRSSAEADKKYAYSYGHLKLKEKTWRDIEALKLEMGSLESKEFQMRLKSLIESDSESTTIDLSEPRISRRFFEDNCLKPGPKRGIGFSKRILGELFLEDKEIATLLTDSEKKYMRENLIKTLAPSEERLAEMEFLPSSGIRAVADLLKSNLISHKDFLPEMRKRSAAGISDELMLKIAISTKPLSQDDIADMAFDIEERHIYDEKLETEMGLMVKTLSPDYSESDASTLDKGRREHFRKLYNHLKSCNKERYALFSEKLVSQTDFYEKLMGFSDEAELDAYLKDTVEKKIGKAIDAINNSNVEYGLKEVYLDQKFDLIYNGSLSGEAVVIKQDIERFQNVFLSENSTDSKKLNKNIDGAIKELRKKISPRGKKEDISKLYALFFCSDAVVNKLFKSRDGVKTLTRKKALTEEIMKAYKNYTDNYALIDRVLKEKGLDPDSLFFGYGSADAKVNKQGYLYASRFVSDLKDKIALTGSDEMEKALPSMLERYEADLKESERKNNALTLSEKDRKRGEEAIAKKTRREDIRTDRDRLLGIDAYADRLDDLMKRKALVSGDTGKKNSLSERDMQLSRDYVATHLSYLELDPFLVDCLVEKNVNRVFNKDIVKHANWLYHISDILSKADEGEEKISGDEKRLLIVRAYRQIEDFKDGEGNFSCDRNLIKGEWYTAFRKNYKALKKFENEKPDFPSLKEEQAGLSKSLRAILVSDAPEDFEKMVSNALRYVSFINGFMKAADKSLEKNERYKNDGKAGKEKYLLSLRQYYHTDLMRALMGDDPSFKEEDWIPELDRFAMDDTLVRFIFHDAIYDSISSEEYRKENRNFVSAAIGRDKIDKLIEEKGSLIQRRKYKNLKAHEKELFCLGLMIMDKGAPGFDKGTISVLSAPEANEERITDRLKELTKYMMGESYDFKVDYEDAFYKLQNLGLGFLGKDKGDFSGSAFDKAMEFTKGIGKKIEDRKNAFSEEDKKRAGDGLSSIYEAALLDKKQIDEVDELRKKSHTASSVREKLLEYARLDGEKLGVFGTDLILKDYPEDLLEREVGDRLGIKDTRIAALYAENRMRVKVLKRLEKMDDTETMKLIALLQNRAALDKSTKDKSKFVDEDKREELRLMFAEDEETGVFKEFSKPSSCLQALISAISFKLKDERHLESGRLKKSDFDADSFNRRSLVDWRLLDQAFDFLDELKKEEVARFAVKNAPEYIEASGNQKAIDAYHKMLGENEEKSVGRAGLEDFLKKQAKKDMESGENEEARIALAGYYALNSIQKRLFIKVLARRDFLDISKKNLYLNLISSKRERGFMNETGRFRLIDEFIEKAARGNEGVALEDDAYKKALKSLLSTQVDDTMEFGEKDNVKDILAGEKFFVFKRDTAVDWKLFTRALQFVNRASYELEMREGNDELYRSAGRFLEYGKLSMDYSILRRNIHSSGNQFVRYGIRRSKKLLVDQVKGLSISEGGFTVEEMAGYILGAAKELSPSLGSKLESLKEALLEDETVRKRRTDLLPDILKGNPVEYVRRMLNEKVEKTLTGTLFTAEEIAAIKEDTGFVRSVIGGTTVKDIASFVQKKINELPDTDRERRIDSVLEGTKVKTTFGEIRDFISSLVEEYKNKDTLFSKAQATADDLKKDLEDLAANQVVNTVGNLYSSALAVVLSEMGGQMTSGGEIKEGLGDIYTEVKTIVDDVAGALGKGDQAVKDLLSAPNGFLSRIQEKAKEKSLEVLSNCVGEEAFERLSETYHATDFMGGTLSDKMSFVAGKFKKIQVCVECFADIALSVKNKNLLSRRTEIAESEETAKEDEETLERAKRVQSSAQQKQVRDVVEEHKDMQKLSGQTSDTIQNLAIADDVIQVLLEAGEEVAKDMGFEAAGIVKDAIKAGTDFALYIIRCMKDRSMLRTYFTETERGTGMVDGIIKGMGRVLNSEDEAKAELEDTDVLDIICRGRGYENIDELVTDTGLKMASSIAYCASRFNPIKQTKIMAVTVMVVLGMKDAVGKTDSATIAGIFDKMKAA